MSRPKKVSFTVLTIIFLAMALALNFILQKDYFTQIGFSGWVFVFSILLLDGSKVFAEVMFFRTKENTGGTTRILLGTFFVLLVLVSAYSTFSVREWPSVEASMRINNENKMFDSKNTLLTNKKSRLVSQIKSLDEEISVKKSLIASITDDRRSKWLRHRYNKEISELNDKKLILVKEIDVLEKQIIPEGQKTISLQAALSKSLGFDSHRLETITNIFIALVIEGIIIFLCFALSHILNEKQEITGNDSIVRTQIKELIPIPYDIDSTDLALIRKRMKMTQSELAEVLGVPRTTISKIETGRKEITEDIRIKLLDLGNINN